MDIVLVPAIYLAVFALSAVLRRPNIENPALVNIRALQAAERARGEAEQSARVAHEFAEKVRREAEKDRERARLWQEAADRAAARAAEEVEQLSAQIEEAANAARRAQELARAATHAAKDEAARLAQETREEQERAYRMQQDAERALEIVKEEAGRAQRIADQRRCEAEAAKALAEDVARTAANETRKAVEAKEEAERRLKEGVRPIVTPSPAEVAAAKQRIQYREDCFHFAVAGVSGSGKSSLVNAFRGLRVGEAGAAAVGVTETTLEMTRYLDANPDNPFVWYDIPGAGTLKCSDWQYFNDQGLYIFDCIIVLVNNRFTMTDVAILSNARRFKIPTYVVRSKADQHIRNLMMEMGYDSEGDDRENIGRRDELYKAARTRFIEETRQSVRTSLEEVNIPDQRVYIVSRAAMLAVALAKLHKNTVDEEDLLSDLIHQVYLRRVSTESDEKGHQEHINSGSGK